MSHYQRLTTAMAVLFLVAPLGAQSATQATAPTSSPIAAPAVPAAADVATGRAAVAGPVRSLPALDPRTKSIPIPPVGAPVPTTASSRNVAMMIVGGAALIVGAVVGGDSGTIIMIGGGALGLYGLWNYLK